MRRVLVCLLAFAVFPVGVTAADLPALPPLSGEISGQLALLKIPGLPALAWRVQARPATGASLAFDATATAPGLELHLALTLPTAAAPGTWRLARSVVELDSWWHLVADQAGPGAKSLPPDLALTGPVNFEGSGAWRGSEFSGQLHVTLAQATARSVSQNWSVTGLALDGEFTVAASRVALDSAQVRAATLEVAGLTARNLALDVAGVEGGRFAVKRAEIGAFGGRITLTPFTLDPVAPAVQSEAEFSGIALAELATLVPQALQEARGQIAGRIAVNWSLKTGVGPGHGALAIAGAEPATLRLADSPGLLTGRSPPKIAFLPSFFGRLRDWTAIDNPAHAMLRRIESGQIPLAVESLDVRLFPDGAAGTRSAQVNVVARPSGAADVVEKVTFTVNVSGPLDQVLRLGLDDRARLKFKSAPP